MRSVINPSLQTEDEFDAMYELYTLQEVVNELRDEKTREFMENLPYKMIIKESGSIVDKKDMEIVEKFAKETGDVGFLSYVDKLVIAAGVSMSRTKGEFNLLKQKPPSLEEFKPKSFQSFYEDDDEDFWNDSDEDDKLKAIPEFPDDGFEVAGTKKQRGKITEESFDFVETKKGLRDTTAIEPEIKMTKKMQKKIEEAKKLMMDSDDEAN